MAECTHPELGFASGGYYVRCVRCAQTWVAKRATARIDADLDRDVQSPLAQLCGHFVWVPDGPPDGRFVWAPYNPGSAP